MVRCWALSAISTIAPHCCRICSIRSWRRQRCSCYVCKLSRFSWSVRRTALRKVLTSPISLQPARAWAFRERDFLEVIQDLGRRGMCRSVDGLPVALGSTVVPTRLAAYAIREMCQDFTYVDFCSIDAAVHDTESRKALQDLSFEAESTQQSPGDRVKLRGSRVELFLEYLMRCEERWVVEAKRRGCG